MLKHLLERDALGQINCKALSYQIFCKISNINVLWELESPCFDLFVGLFHFLRLKRWSAIQHGVQNNSNTPNVNFVAMTTILKHFRSQVIWGTANGTLLLSCVKDLSCQTEIANFKNHILRQEQVTKLQVSVNNFAGVDILDCFDQLMDVITCFNLVESLSALDHIGQGLVRADIEHDVYIFFILKISIESYYIFMIERSMNLNLACQFLAGFSPDKVGLGNNFQGPGRCLVLWSLYRLDSFNLVALSEASLA